MFTTTTAASVQQIVPWILFHRALGVSHFFLFVEGQAAKPKNAAVLQAMEVRATPALLFATLGPRV